jgi:hypothetical protein
MYFPRVAAGISDGSHIIIKEHGLFKFLGTIGKRKQLAAKLQKQY